MCPSHWRVPHIWKHVSIVHTDNTTIWRSALCPSEDSFLGGGTLVKAIKHYRLSRGTPFECNIKACTINKSIFLVSARLELWQSISPLRQKSVIRREQRGGCATSKQAARLSSHLQSSRDRMLCSWGLGGGGLSRVWAVAVPVEESKSSFPSLLTSQPLPFRWKLARLNLSMRIDNKGTRGQNLPTLLGKLRGCRSVPVWTSPVGLTVSHPSIK